MSANTTEMKMQVLKSLSGWDVCPSKEYLAYATVKLVEKYNLLVDVTAFPDKWKIEFNDGQQQLKLEIDDSGVPELVRQAAKELVRDYTMRLADIAMDKGPLQKNENPTDPMKNLEDSGFEFGSQDQKEEKASPEEPKKPPKSQGKRQAAPSSSAAVLDLIHSYVGNDVLEIFGETGSGKSKFAMKVAREAIASGKKVFYLDTERNLTEADIAGLKGCEYKYTPLIEEIDKIVQKLPNVDVVIVDSIGFPVLTTFARMSMKQKGDSLLKLIAIFGDLKEWAYKNNGIVIVTNQPESEFNKAPDHKLRPFGDKSQFAAKEIWETSIVERAPRCTKTEINAFRSRSVGQGTKIAGMRINVSGVEVI